MLSITSFGIPFYPQRANSPYVPPLQSFNMDSSRPHSIPALGEQHSLLPRPDGKRGRGGRSEGGAG